MKRVFIVAIRNDQNQILVLVVRDSGTPVLPGGVFEGNAVLSAVRKRIVEDTALEIGGLHLLSTRTPSQGTEVHRYTAFVARGKLRLPSAFSSASWVAPELVMKISGMPAEALELMKDLSSVHEGRSP